MIATADGFSYNGSKPNFERDQFITKAAMTQYAQSVQNRIDEGHISYCIEDKKHYVWKGTAWEELKTGGGGGTSNLSVSVEGNTLIFDDTANKQPSA